MRITRHGWRGIVAAAVLALCIPLPVHAEDYVPEAPKIVSVMLDNLASDGGFKIRGMDGGETDISFQYLRMSTKTKVKGKHHVRSRKTGTPGQTGSTDKND